ncbi:hypothetical protein QTP88_019634 [Uroleucon formosanum]
MFTTPVRSYVGFITEPSDIVTTAGKTLRLDCVADFYSFGKIPQYEWTLNGEKLDFIGDTRRSILKNGSLLIKNVFNNDNKGISEGLESYKCVAFVNSIGVVVSRTASVILARKLNDEGNYVCRAKNCEGTVLASAKIDVLVKPQFIHTPKDTIGFEKENITLECEVTGKPPPKVIWLKNGDIIKPNEYMQVING